MSYQHIVINVKPYPLDELIDPRDPLADTPRQKDIRAEVNLATAAPELADALEALLDAVLGSRVTVGDCNQARAALTKAGL